MSRLLEAMQQTPASEPQSVYFSAQQNERSVSSAWNWLLAGLIVLCLVTALFLTGIPGRLLVGISEPAELQLEPQTNADELVTELVKASQAPDLQVAPPVTQVVPNTSVEPGQIRVLKRPETGLRPLSEQVEVHRKAMWSAELWHSQQEPAGAGNQPTGYDDILEVTDRTPQRGFSLDSDEARKAGVSPELLARFENAMELSDTPQDLTTAPSEAEELALSIQDLPQVQRDAIPELYYQSHVYSTDLARRSVKLNEVTYREGDWIEPNLQLLEIRPRQSILRYGRQSFRLPALEDHVKNAN